MGNMFKPVGFVIFVLNTSRQAHECSIGHLAFDSTAKIWCFWTLNLDYKVVCILQVSKTDGWFHIYKYIYIYKIINHKS